MPLVAIRSVGFAVAMVAAVLFAWQARAEPNDVSFPVIDDLTHYTTVTRGSTVEHMLTTSEALAALKAGEPVPTGTHLVLQDFQSGELYRFLVAQKMTEAPEGWQYQWYWPDGTIKTEERTDQCYSCHRSRETTQFMFTHDDAVNFVVE
jgi:hypothetical protein